jgi:hypothetical protein
MIGQRRLGALNESLEIIFVVARRPMRTSTLAAPNRAISGRLPHPGARAWSWRRNPRGTRYQGRCEGCARSPHGCRDPARHPARRRPRNRLPLVRGACGGILSVAAKMIGVGDSKPEGCEISGSGGAGGVAGALQQRVAFQLAFDEAARSRFDNCSSLIACISCGVITSDWLWRNSSLCVRSP